MANPTARRFAILLVLLSLAAFPTAAEPLRARPSGPVAAFSDVVAGLTEKLLSLWRRTEEIKPVQPSTNDKEGDCRSTLDPWGCPEN